MKEEIVLKHLAKYYNRKGRTINNDDILPMSRILPMMDEYAQEYHKSQSTTQQQAGTGWSDEEVIDLLENYISKYGREKAFGWFMLHPFDPAINRNYVTTQQLISTYKKNNLKT